jgi:predicted nucleic acid-binding protein
VNRLLLDTNVVSELTNDPQDPNVIAFISQQTDMWIASLVVHEISFGILLLSPGRRRDDSSLANARILTAFRDRILLLDRSAAVWAARFRVQARRLGQPLALADALIAGTAKANDLTVVTRNVRDFTGLDIEIINPWEHETS